MHLLIRVSKEVRMLHWHIETLFNHRVFIRNIRPRADSVICFTCPQITLRTFIFKSLLACIKYYLILQVLASWLAKSLRSYSLGDVLWVLPGPRNFELQALPIKCLIIVEPRWCSIEPNTLTSIWFVVICSSLTSPFVF